MIEGRSDDGVKSNSVNRQQLAMGREQASRPIQVVLHHLHVVPKQTALVEEHLLLLADLSHHDLTLQTQAELERPWQPTHSHRTSGNTSPCAPHSSPNSTPTSHPSEAVRPLSLVSHAFAGLTDFVCASRGEEGGDQAGQHGAGRGRRDCQSSLAPT